MLVRKFIRGEQVTEEGVIIPEEQDSRSQRGVVVGLSHRGNPWDIEIGDTVIFTNFPMDIPAIEELTGEKDLVLVQSDEIFAVAVEA